MNSWTRAVDRGSLAIGLLGEEAFANYRAPSSAPPDESRSGKLVAILYVFSCKKHAFFYQNGWAPDLAPYGVGLIGVQRALRHAAEAGYKSFDFLRGEEPYKYDFCGDIRRAYAIRIFGRGARGHVLERLFTLKGGIKRGLAAARVRAPGATGRATRAGTTRGIRAWN